MGCDIHAYVEYRHKKEGAPWRPFGKEFRLDRDYLMFGVLAGVRADVSPVVEPRGVPDDMSWNSDNDYWLYIADRESDHPRYCTHKAAEKYIEMGCRTKGDRDGKPVWVQHPDWHTHSWLTVNEYEASLSKYRVVAPTHYDMPSMEPGCEYEALLAAMRSIESCGDHAVRLVFWFDN